MGQVRHRKIKCAPSALDDCTAIAVKLALLALADEQFPPVENPTLRAPQLNNIIAVWTSEARVSCKSCQSTNTRTFSGEIDMHFPGLKGLNKPIVWVFPKIAVCLDCGFAEFLIPETELRLLAEGDSAAA
jgi:hypothetical protein